MYVELRTRSAFSFLQGASLPEDLIQRAAALGYSAIALGDRDGVYGVPRFHQAAKKAGVRALIGAELTLHHPAPFLERRGKPAPPPLLDGVKGGCTVYLLAANRNGYQNLCHLITLSKLRAPKGESWATWADLEGRSEGLICLVRDRQQTTEDLLSAVGCLQSHFSSVYIDLQRHLDADEERLNRVLIDVARHCKIPLVATNDVRHATAGGRRLLDVLTCIHDKTTLDAAGRVLLSNAERHLKAPAEMVGLFRDLPEAIANTQRIAEQCEFTLADLGYRFPDYPLPAGETAAGHLRALTYAGARERYGVIGDKVRRQLEHELHIIGKLHLEGYFLIVWDIVRFCREQKILMQGRGSAANSAVCYALGITAVDAVGMELLFERFLSEERGEWPDIDIDLPSGDQREKVIQYVYRRYGERGAAMTANVITYRTRSAIREVGKALGFSLEQVDRLSKLLRRFEFRDDSDDLIKQLKAGGVDAQAPRVRQLVELVGQIQNLPRHLGQHSGGMVIAAGRLDSVVPLEPASMPGRVVVQWDKDDCADLGIIKVDLLGLGMMAVLEDAIPLIREHEGVDIDLAHLPVDDPKTYAMMRKADTIGVFQIESRAQMATLPRMNPERFYDLVVEVAIIRPGPIVGQMVHPYLNRRNRREPVRYDHPDLEPILKRTLGVPIFQEQLLRMAMTLADFTGGEAEELRRAMGFKRSVERMREIEARLRRGIGKRGIVGKAQDDIVRSITSFALYGFPESHAASFALLAYASAFLRAHHLAAFTCAMLNNWPLGFYHPATLVKDAQRHGLRVLPIDVTRSGWKCALEKIVPPQRRRDAENEELIGEIEINSSPRLCVSAVDEVWALRLGLNYVIGLRADTGKRIEAERAVGPFTSIADVVQRCALRDDEAQRLAHLGAFAVFGRTRREALWQVAAVAREPLLRILPQRHRGTEKSPGLTPEREKGGGEPEDAGDPSVSLSLRGGKSFLPEMTSLERSLADYKSSGLTPGPHIMTHVRAELRQAKVLRASDLFAARNGQWVKVAGLVIVRQRPGTAKGMCFITLEDESGTANAAVMPQVFAQYRALIHTAAMLIIEGPLQKIVGSAVKDPVSGVAPANRNPAPEGHPVIHILARRLSELRLPQQPIHLSGSGYRMQVSPADPEPQSPASTPSFPKSHDFR